MNFGEAIKTCFSKYFVFSGRAQRSEYWWFYLFTIIGSIIFSIMDLMAFGARAVETISPLNTLFSLAVIIPTISAAARRLHDTNRSGWWQLLPLAPFPLLLLAIPGLVSGGESMFAAGILMLVVLAMLGLVILLIVWLATRGTDGPNRFGEDPLGDSIADTFS